MTGVMADPGLVILGVIGLFANTLAVMVGAFLTSRSARRAQYDALQAQLATTKAAEDASRAQKAAADAARQLVISARDTDNRLAQMQEIARDTNEVANVTHKFVDGQRTE